MNYELYIALLVAIVIGVILIKKVASCLFRFVVGIILLGILGYALHYLGYI